MTPKEIPVAALGEALAAGDYEVLRLAALRFDSTMLADALAQVRRRFALRVKNANPTYRGICLQTCRDTDDPLYGLLNWRLAQGATPAVEPTAAAEAFAAVFDAFAPYVVLNRGRLLELHPGHDMPFHSDGPGSRRIHIAIATAPSCRIEFEGGGAWHLPADGSCFLVNTERGHRATNPSTAPRVHLVFQARSLAAARAARATPKLRLTITRQNAPAPLDPAELRPCLDALDWQHALRRYAKAGTLLSRATEAAEDGATLTLVSEFDTLEALGEFLREGAVARLEARLAEQRYRLETEIV